MPIKIPAIFPRVIRGLPSFFTGLASPVLGGPAAHLGYFNQRLIQRKKWASDIQYGEW